jgi:hypothetical protein
VSRQRGRSFTEDSSSACCAYRLTLGHTPAAAATPSSITRWRWQPTRAHLARRRRVSTLFQVPASAGLAEWLEERALDSPAEQTCMQVADTEGVVVGHIWAAIRLPDVTPLGTCCVVRASGV